MFFVAGREHFFKPLTSKYREQVVTVLCLLYQRLYGASADYGSALGREQLVEIFTEAITLAPEQSYPVADTDDYEEQLFKSPRELASWILKSLLEAGWIEKQLDPATLQSTYPLSRMGRVLTQALLESSGSQVRTRHRNTRNTLNALEAFLRRGEEHDLLDAYEYSERIVSDFSDVISELEERKRELVRELEAQALVEHATQEFFDFMEKRFQPDVAVRLSADSVEKHRAAVNKAIAAIRALPKADKTELEQRLRRLLPELVVSGQSVLWRLLDTIEQRMRNAAEVMLPALRQALHGFTKRADIIIRQLSYLNSQQDSDILDICRHLSQLDEEQYQQALNRAGQTMSSMNMGWLDPAQIKLHERRKQRVLHNMVFDDVEPELDQQAQQESMIQQLLDQAFMFNNQQLSDYISRALRSGETISSKDLAIDDARDLLAMAHIIEVAAINSHSSEYEYQVDYVGSDKQGNDYFSERDEFSIRLLAKAVNEA